MNFSRYSGAIRRNQTSHASRLRVTFVAVALIIALSRYLAELHQVHESTFLIFF